MQATVASERDPALAGAPLEGADRAAEQVAILVGEVAVGDAADVVLADDLRVQRGHELLSVGAASGDAEAAVLVAKADAGAIVKGAVATDCDFRRFEPESPVMKSRRKGPTAGKRDGGGLAAASLPQRELDGLLDDVKATVIALLASLRDKERHLRRRLRGGATPGVRTGLSDIRLLRHWAERTLRTVEVLERGQQQGDLRTLLAELGEFGDIVHAHDAEVEA